MVGLRSEKSCCLVLLQLVRLVAVDYMLWQVINCSILKSASIPVLLRARCCHPGRHWENDGILVLLKLFSLPLVPTLLLIHLISVLQILNVLIGTGMVLLAFLDLFVVIVANAQVQI